MKSKLISIIFTAALLSLAEAGFAQGFVNLNFENAHFTGDPSGNFPPYSVYASNSIPGWTVYLGGVPQTDILSNEVTLGSAMVSIQGTNLPNSETLVGFVEPALQGRWSIFLQGFFGNTNGFTGGTPIVASIGQTGQIPLTANSLLFWGYFPYQNNFTLTFDGQDLSLVTISNALNYTVFGADVSGFAGQTGQLLFAAGNNTYAELDNISFSTLPVPEPSAFALAALGALFLGFSRRRRYSKSQQLWHAGGSGRAATRCASQHEAHHLNCANVNLNSYTFRRLGRFARRHHRSDVKVYSAAADAKEFLAAPAG